MHTLYMGSKMATLAKWFELMLCDMSHVQIIKSISYICKVWLPTIDGQQMQPLTRCG